MFTTSQQFIENLHFNFIIDLCKLKGFNSLERSLNDLRKFSIKYIENCHKEDYDDEIAHMNKLIKDIREKKKEGTYIIDWYTD